MDKKLVVATANIHEGKTLRDTQGLEPFISAAVDAITLQEVLGWDKLSLEERLSESDFDLAHFDNASGLAVALNRHSTFTAVPGTERIDVLQEPERIGRAIKKIGLSIGDRLRSRSLLSVKISDGDKTVTIGSTHPIVFVRSKSRAKQLKALGQVLKDPYFETNPLVVAGDMNHYPGPRRADITMRKAAGLLIAKTSEPTFKVEGTVHEKTAKAAAFITRRSIESFDATLDAILYNGLYETKTQVIDISSDHRAIVTEFSF